MKTSPLISSNNHLLRKRKFRLGEVNHDELSLDSLKIISVDKVKSSSSITERNVKAPSSSLSSIILENNKGGVKRKLDFDADCSSDEDSAVRRENGKRICLRDFRSINSSLIDTDSNPFSPSKNRRPSAASYSRSSISSSCRRRLFPYQKKKNTDENKHESPVLRSNTDSKQEIKLSLKKKFPGVPNSDNARSGLLLNLAFSKFNLPNATDSDKKTNVSYDFVDHASVSKTTKKDFIHYSSIKKDDSSLCQSPVFMAIKKVKRRLNLEEHESCSDSKEGDSSFCDKEKTPRNSDTNEGSKFSNNASIKKSSVGAFSKKNDFGRRLRTDSTSDNENYSRLSVNPSSSVISKKQQPGGDLFKNSKLRLSLRNKIFDLSTFSTDGGNHSAADVNIHDLKSVETSSGVARDSVKLSSNERSFSSKNSEGQRSKPKYDRIVVRRDLIEKTRRDAERLKRLSVVSSDSSNVQRQSRKPSIGRSARGPLPKSDCCRMKTNNSFIDAHMKRFLNDCTDMAKLKLDSSKDESQFPMSEMNEEEPLSLEPSVSFNEFDSAENTCVNNPEIDAEQLKSSTLIEDTDSNNESPVGKRDVVDISVSRRIIEDINSPELEWRAKQPYFMIENICTQESTEKGGESRIHDITMDDDNFTETLPKDISFSSDSVEFKIVKVDHKIEEAVTPKSELVDDFDDNYQSNDQEKILPDTEDILNSQQKKRSRKKHGSDSLCGRLHRLVKREKSEAHIWKYEAYKRKTTNNVAINGMTNGPVIFSIEKMWKEFSRLVILCSRIYSDLPGIPFPENLGSKVSHSVVIVIESELFPKSITCSSTFRVHPPWKIFYSSAQNLQIIFRPAKIEMISTHGKSLLYKDSTLPSHPRIVERSQLCFCLNTNCDCVLPESYLTVIPSLLSLFSNNVSTTCCLRSYTLEDVQCARSIDDLIIVYRLLSTTELPVELEVLNIDCSFDKIFRLIICTNDRAEICCILIKDEIKNISLPKVQMRYRFTGLIPWKAIPPRLVPTLVKYLNLKKVNLISKLETNGIYIFVLSRQNGNIHPVYF